MPALLSDKFRVDSARDFKTSFGLNTYYAMIGKVTPWEDPNNYLVNDNTPPFPSDSVQNIQYQIWRDGIAAKRVMETDVSLVIPRVNWVSGTEYSSYSDVDADLNSRTFYVMTDDLRVYKCIEKPLTGVSTIKPTTISTTVHDFGSDGYRWKYMYSLNAVDIAKFYTSRYIPVKTLLSNPMDGSVGTLQWNVQQNAINGGIESVQMISGGTGYTTATATITGDGTGAEALVVLQSGSIKNIVMQNFGTGYTQATVTIDGNGSDAEAVAIISPIGGHGKDPEEELGANFSMVYSIFETDEGGFFTVENDYRQISLIRNPLEDDLSPATDFRYRQTMRLTLTIDGTLEADDLITTPTATARVVEVDGPFAYINNVMGILTTGSYTAPTATGVISAIQNPGIKLYSGDVVVVENRKPSPRASDQSEEIRMTVEF